MNKARENQIRDVVAKMSLSEKAQLCSGADFWHTESLPRLGIESIMMADGPHGLRVETDTRNMGDNPSAPATCFPTASALGCSFDRDLLHEIGQALAAEARAADVDVLLGPGINIKRSPLCGRNFEYLSEDPYLSGELGAAEIKGIQSGGVGACLKHFCANNQENKRMVSDSCVDNRTLHELYLEAFRIAVQKGQPYAVMSSYNKVNGEYAGESEYLIRDILRGRMGFSGAVISDWAAVDDRVQGIRAGLDLEMPGKTSHTASEIIAAVREEELDIEQLDDCLVRILDLVMRCHEARPVRREVDYNHHHELCRRAAAESAVLLKNEENLLPFDNGAPFAIIGRLALVPRMQGAGSSRVNPAASSSVVDEAARRGLRCPFAEGYNEDGSANDTLIAEARRMAVETGRAVVFAGLLEEEESEGYDRDDLALPDGMLKLIDAVSAACPNTVVYLMVGTPVVMPFAARVPAIVCGHLGGQAAGAAAVDVITGRMGPGGRLAESWPERLSDLPSTKYFGKNRKLAEYREGPYVGYRYYLASNVRPMFPFGHGLSYTRFRFDAISCDRRTLGALEKAVVGMRVTNTGKRQGSTVAQIYISQKDSPMRVLRQFEKVHLFAGESRILSFELDADSFACHNSESDRRVVEMGEYTIYVATSSVAMEAALPMTVWAGEEGVWKPEMPVQLAFELSDAAFAERLGYTPQEPERTPFSMNSTAGELRARTAGKILYSVLQSATAAETASSNAALAQKKSRMVDDMPLRAICAMSKGMLPKSMAKAVVNMANRKYLRGMYYAIKKKT